MHPEIQSDASGTCPKCGMQLARGQEPERRIHVVEASHGRAHALGGGVVAGIIGGIVIAIVLVVSALVKGGDLWVPLKGAAAPFLHERAAQPGFDATAVALGAICHFAISIVWGVLFAALFYGLSRGATVAAGVGWGIVVWAVMYYAVLPLAGLADHARATPVPTAILSHVVFGLAVALGFLPFQHPRLHARHAHAPS